jgi:hypothetical protein
MIEQTNLTRRRAPAPLWTGRPDCSSTWNDAASIAVEISAPTRTAATALLAEVGPHFRSKVVAGEPWTVRFQAPASRAWVFEFLSDVERWLQTCRLPCGEVHYGGRSYRIPAGAPWTEAVPPPPDVVPTWRYDSVTEPPPGAGNVAEPTLLALGRGVRVA